MAKLVLSDLGGLADLTLELSCALTDFADRYPPHHPVHAFARQTRILARDLTRDPDLLIRGLRGKVPPLRGKGDPRDPYALRNLRPTESLDPMKKPKTPTPKIVPSVKKVPRRKRATKKRP